MVYWFATSQTGSLEAATQVNFPFDQVTYTGYSFTLSGSMSGCTSQPCIKMPLLNYGSTPITVIAIYVDGNPRGNATTMSLNSGKGYTIQAGLIQTFNLDGTDLPAGIIKGSSHIIKVVTDDTSQFSFTFTAGQSG